MRNVNIIHIKSGITINVSCEHKKHICQKDYIQNPATLSCKYGKFLASIIDDLVITSDKIIDTEAKSYDEETKTVTIHLNEKKMESVRKFFILFAFLSITIALLIGVSIYCYLVKYKSKQKYLLPFYVTIDK